MHRSKCRARWHLLRHSLLFVPFRRASDSLLPVLRRTRQDSIKSNAPWETQIDFWTFSSDEPITRSMPTIERQTTTTTHNDFQRLVQHLKNYDRFLLDFPRRKERTFSEFIFNDLSFSLTRLPRETTAKRTSLIEKNPQTSPARPTNGSAVQTRTQFTPIGNAMEELMQRLFEGKKTGYAAEQHQLESTRIRKQIASKRSARDSSLAEDLQETFETAKRKCFFPSEEIVVRRNALVATSNRLSFSTQRKWSRSIDAVTNNTSDCCASPPNEFTTSLKKIRTRKN